MPEKRHILAIILALFLFSQVVSAEICFQMDSVITFRYDNSSQAIIFDGSASKAGNGIQTYRINFGDGTELKDYPSAEHDYGVPGTFHIIFEVTDKSGNSAIQDFDLVTKGKYDPPAQKTIVYRNSIPEGCTINDQP